MIQSYGDMKTFISADLRNMGVQRTFFSVLREPSATYVVTLRFYEYCLNTNKPSLLTVIVKFLHKHLSIKLGFSLGPNIFDSGLAIVHYGLLIVDPTTKVGKNCRIHMGVHIGGTAQFVDPSEQEKFSPRIGDNVYLGPGAKIYGPVTIGDNCTIGANSVVTKSFTEPGLTIAGVPAKPIGRIEGTNARTTPRQEFKD